MAQIARERGYVVFDFFIWNTHLSTLFTAALSIILIRLLLTLGPYIRWGRLVRGLSQEKLAELLGVHSRTVQRWENGMPPRAYHLKKLVEFQILDEAHMHFALDQDHPLIANMNRYALDGQHRTQIVINVPKRRGRSDG